MRIRIFALLLMLLAAACGGADTASTSTEGTDAPSASVAPTTGVVPDSTEQPGATPTTATPASPEGPIAPDFVTVLADGSNFDFGAHDKPVYLVFWAEW